MFWQGCASRELDDALGLTDLAEEVLVETRTGQNSRHTLIAQLRQSVFGRLAGYEDVNDADRLAHDPALHWIVGGRAVKHIRTYPIGPFSSRKRASWLAIRGMSAEPHPASAVLLKSTRDRIR
jgi:Transposase DDE domain group 1